MTPPRPPSRGFTLIELMVVVAIIAIIAGLVSVSLPDPSATRLEQEASRLTALLEAARAEARSSGLAVRWEPHGDGRVPQDFRFVGLPATNTMPDHWLTEGVRAEVVGALAVVLGPEPLIGAQRVVLSLAQRHLILATDGLGPFVVVDE